MYSKEQNSSLLSATDFRNLQQPERGCSIIQYRSLSLTWSATFFKEKKFFTWEEKSLIQVPEDFWVHQHGRCFIVFSGTLVGSLSNDDSDGNEDGKKARGLDWQNNNFVRASHCFVHFVAVVLRLRHETADVNTRQRPSFSISFPELQYSPLVFNSRKIRQHLMNRARWNKRDEV